MRIILLVLSAGVGFCQTVEDAGTLIQDVAGAARKATTWHIEGSIRYLEPAASYTSGDQFKLLMRSSTETRFEQLGRSPAVIACDGINAWVYSPPLHRYRKEPLAEDKLCSPVVGDWKLLPTSLQSPVLAGTCGPEPSIESRDYRLVSAFSEPELSSAGRIRRTLCIDPDRKLIVWEKWESHYSGRLYVYSSLDRNAEFTPDAFAFEPPTNSTPTDLELPSPRPLGAPSMSRRPGISLPRPVSRTAPRYPKESGKAGIEGTVVLYVVINSDGSLSDELVYRPLSPDFDAEAVRCVKRWRFAPGTSNGRPVALPVLIEVNFQMIR